MQNNQTKPLFLLILGKTLEIDDFFWLLASYETWGDGLLCRVQWFYFNSSSLKTGPGPASSLAHLVADMKYHKQITPCYIHLETFNVIPTREGYFLSPCEYNMTKPSVHRTNKIHWMKSYQNAPLCQCTAPWPSLRCLMSERTCVQGVH